MNIELQLIMYHIDGKSMWTVLVITLRRGHVCKHSGISVQLLSCILYYNKITCTNSEMAHICMYVHVCVCVFVCAYISMCAHMYVCIYGHQPESFSYLQSSLPSAKGRRGRMLRYISYDQQR